MTFLEEALAGMLNKANNVSEAKHLAVFVQDILEESPGDYNLVTSSLRMFVDAAIELIDATARTVGRNDVASQT